MPATIKLYDTLTRTTPVLSAADGTAIRFYCCGPTVYGPAHIGNFRTFLLQDTLRRVLEVAGHSVNHVRNITDVDDKTIRQSQTENQSLTDFTQYWTERFHEDCEALNMLPPTTEPKATDHISEQIALIQNLVDKGHAYAAADGSVYFRVCGCKDYGKLSHLNPEELVTQDTNSADQRNDADEYEREAISDFALWKSHKSEDGDNAWDSPWGKGRPGWHIECSAMSMKYLGESFDLHGGGIDLCFPHHENEIAQSECGTGTAPFARHWFHCAHLMVEGKKMSKSLGNFWRLDDVRDQGFSPMALRYALISGHYRQQLNLTVNGLQAAKSGLEKIEKGVRTLLAKYAISESDFKQWNDTPSELATTGVFEPAWSRLANDLNVPACLGELFSSIKHLDRPDFDKTAMRGQLEALGGLLYALGLKLFTADAVQSDAPEAIVNLAQQRWEAKQNRDFATADALRAEIQSHGWTVLDRKDGFDLEPSGS